VQNYPVRPTHRPNLALPALESLARAEFGTAQVEGDRVVTSFGALRQLSVSVAGREIAVETTMDPKVPNEVARETITRYNRFLEAATGYSAKERAKRLRKSAGEA